MSSAKLTMIGLYQYDNTLFNGLIFPTGIDKQTAVDEILTRCGEFEVLYPDILFMKQMIIHWGNKHYRTFDKWIKALEIEFEPLYNYDRFEEYTDEKKANGSVSSKANSIDNSSETENASDRANSVSQTATDSTSSDTNTRGVSAYDSNDYQPREQENRGNTSGQTGNGTAQNESSSESSKSSNNTTNSEQNTESNNTEELTHKAHLYGNIGVTTSAQMLEDYIRVERFNIYEQIADIFVDEFCLMVY